MCQWQLSKCARAAARAHSLRMNNNTLDGWITVKHGEPVKAAVQAGGAGAMRGAACVQAPPRGLFAARGASAPLAAPLLAQAAGGAGAQGVEPPHSKSPAPPPLPVSYTHLTLPTNREV